MSILLKLHYFEESRIILTLWCGTWLWARECIVSAKILHHLRIKFTRNSEWIMKFGTTITYQYP